MLSFPLQTSHTERIDALELLGATFVDKKRDLLGALKYWKRAMDLRYLDSNNITHKPEPKQLIMAYDYAREVSTSLSFHLSSYLSHRVYYTGFFIDQRNYRRGYSVRF